MTDEKRLELLLTEYEQTGEEYRARQNLLHNSYYLFVIGLAIFGGAAINVLDKPQKLGLLLILGSLASFILGFAIITHFIERQSAGALRTRTEQAIEEMTNSDVNHGLDIQRPISIQYHMIGQNVTMDENQELEIIEKDSEAILNEIFSIPDFSAKTLGQVVLFLSTSQLVAGIVYLSGWVR